MGLVVWYRTMNYRNGIYNYIYLDNNATTAILPEALTEYNRTSYLGNASSSYNTNGRELIEKHISLVKDIFDDDKKIVFTSGASESNNTIIKLFGDSGYHIVSSELEHKSSLDCLKNYSHTLLQPDARGRLSVQQILNALQPNTGLVTLMHVNNELGNKYDIENIAAQIKLYRPDIYIHTDATQSFGKYIFETKHIDAISASYHKIYGPVGLGILAVSSRLAPLLSKHPLIYGSQNYGLRGGTMNLPAIAAGYVSLSKLVVDRRNKNQHLMHLKQYILDFLYKHFEILDYHKFYNQPDTFYVPGQGCEIVILGDNQVPNCLLIGIVKRGNLQNHFCNINLRDDLYQDGVIVSISSACQSDKPEPSHVLRAIKAPFVVRCGVIRISLGDHNSKSDVQRFCKLLKKNIYRQI